MSDAPERIWLQLYGDASPDDGPADYKYDGVTWCWENIFEHDVEYVRADRVVPLKQAYESAHVKALADRIAELESALREIANSAWSGVAERAIAREVLGK